MIDDSIRNLHAAVYQLARRTLVQIIELLAVHLVNRYGLDDAIEEKIAELLVRNLFSQAAFHQIEIVLKCHVVPP